MIFTGLLMGIILGILLQRGRICFNSAFRDILLFKDNYLIKFALLTLALQMILFYGMAQFGWIAINPKPLNIPGNIIGGLIFGVGMVLAGGCASGVTYRAGEGMTTAWFAALFYALTAYSTKKGLLSGWLQWIGQYTVKVEHSNPLFVSKSGPSLSSWLNINPWIIVVIVAALLLIVTFATKTSQRSTKLNWIIAAVLVAISAAFAYYFSSKTGRMSGYSITSGWINIIDVIVAKKPFNWIGLVVLGVIVGAAGSALFAKEFKLRMPKKPITFATVMLGAMLMGFGAVTAGGCNIGHFLTGVPMLGLSSIIASVCFVLGNWALAWFLFGRN